MNNSRGTDESAWEKQWWNLVPSPMFHDPWKKIEDLKRHGSFVALTQDEVTID